MFRRTALATALAALVLPAGALAAGPAIATKAADVTAAGTTTVKLSNPTKRTLKGTATLHVKRTKLATSSVRLARRGTTSVTLKLSAKALETLRSAGGKATLKLTIRRGATTTRTVTLRFAAAATPPPAPAPAPSLPSLQAPPPAPAPAPAPPQIPGTWKGTAGTDTFTATVAGGVLQFGALIWMPVMCTDTLGATYTARERFVFRGPWTLGANTPQTRWSVAINPLVGGAERVMEFNVTGATATATQLTGTLTMAFTDRRAESNGSSTDVTCSGAQPFAASPA